MRKVNGSRPLYVLECTYVKLKIKFGSTGHNMERTQK